MNSFDGGIILQLTLKLSSAFVYGKGKYYAC